MRDGETWRTWLVGLIRRVLVRSNMRARILTALALVVAAGALLWLTGLFAERLEDNRRWVETVRVSQTSLLSNVIFQRLIDQNLIWVARGPRSVEIRHVSCENSMQRIESEMPAGSDPRAMRDVFQLLCVAPQGELIRNEIEQWNRSFLLLAVRDNRDINGESVTAPQQRAQVGGALQRLCRDRKTAVSRVIMSGCYPSEWRAEFMRGGVAVPTAAQENAVPPYRDFAFVAAEGRYWSGDWMVATALERTPATPAGQAEPSEFYRLKTTIKLGPEPVAVDVIGRPLRLRIGGQTYPVRPSQLNSERPVNLGPFQIEHELLCDEQREDELIEDCSGFPDPEAGVAFAFWFNLTGRPGSEAEVEVDAEPISVFPRELAERVANVPPLVLRRTPHLEVACDRNWAPVANTDPGNGRTNSGCGVQWITPEVVERAAAREPYRILPRDGTTELTAPQTGIVTQAALDAGLAPVVGLTPQDVGSLVAVLDGLPRQAPEDFRLTIDMRMQVTVQQVLDREAPCRGVRTIARPRSARRASRECPDHHEDLRAAVVLLDAGSDDARRGEVLAVAGWPSVSPGLPAWDLAALEIGAPSRSPVSGMPWRAVDISATPGSSFKLVAGLAAIESSLNGDERLERLLRGDLDLGAAARMLQLAARRNDAGDATPKRARPCTPDTFNLNPRDPNEFNTLPIPNRNGTSFFCAGNASENARTPFSNALLPPQGSGCQGANPRGGPRLGLCESLIKSSNLFFGGLALYLDRAKLVRPGPGGREIEVADALPELAMARMSRRLFPDSFPPTPRPSNSAATQRPLRPARGFDLLRGQLDRDVPRLLATPMLLRAAASAGPGDSRRIALGLAGYGQAVSATTLAMASAYASLGSGRIVRPRLLPRAAGRSERVQDENEGRPLIEAVPAGKTALRDDLLQLMRRGLAGVVARPGGTATGQFAGSPLVRPLGAEILFAKTGTATIGKACKPGPGSAPEAPPCPRNTRESNLYSAWLAGWLEPVGMLDRRIAFACTVTHTFAFGGDACGQIVRQILEQISSAPAPPRPGR